jgi:hypothetical protein
MPVHDWSVVPAGLFHHFHQLWSATLCNRLNQGALPDGYFALIEQSAARFYPDVLTLRETDESGTPVGDEPRGGIAVADAPPKARFVSRASEAERYALRANRVVVRTTGDRLVSALEIVSPGNKGSQRELELFLRKSIEFLVRGVNLLIVDLFPPTARDPQGLHPLIWGEAGGGSDDGGDAGAPFALPADERLTLASYMAGPPPAAYVEPLRAGAVMPDVPLFIAPEVYVPCPLEESYAATWEACPRQFRAAVTGASA